MIQAEVTSITSRRTFLAGAALVAIAPVTAAATPMHGVAASADDPIFELIEACRKADTEVEATLAEVYRRIDLAKEITGMDEVSLTIPSPNPYSGLGPIVITCKSDIDAIVSREHCPQLNEDYHAQWDKLAAEREAILGDEDAMLYGPFRAQWAALDNLVSCEPTTMSGAVAWIDYLNGVNEADEEMIGHERFQSLLPRVASVLKKLNAA